MFFFRRSATCALTVTVLTLSCGLAARAQVGVTQPAPVAAVGVAPTDEVAGVTTAPPVGAAPVKTPVIGAAAVGALGGVKASGVNTGLLLLLGQIADGQMTMDAAWQKGLLDAPKVLQLLSQTQRLTEDTRNETLQRDLAGLLVKLAPATVATPDRLSARVRVALCRYYSSVGDERVVPLCEALIAEKLDGKQTKQPLPSNPDGGSSSLYLSSVICLAQYYERVEQWQKAGQTWERALGFWQDADWWQASVRIEAARAYVAAKEPEKAHTLYAQVPQVGQAWFSGLALWDQANALIKQGEHQQARLLLQQAVAREGGKADQMQVPLLTSLAASFFQKGELAEAVSYAQAALDRFEGIREQVTDVGITQQASRSKSILIQAQRWQTAPITCEPNAISVLASLKGESLTLRFVLSTFRNIPVTVTADDPLVKAVIASEGQFGDSDGDLAFQRQVTVSIPSEMLTRDVEVTLIAQTPEYPKFNTKTQIQISASSAITP